MSNLVFLDTETTSLRHDRRVWEVALIARDPAGAEEEYHCFIEFEGLDLGNADPASLRIGRFYERHPYGNSDNIWGGEPEGYAMRQVEQLTRGATVVGAVPWFDTDVLGQRMRANGVCPSWHYHLIDVEGLAAGALRLPQPWDFDALLSRHGLAYDEAERHTALGDARMVRDLYDAVMTKRESDTAVVGRLIEAA